MKQAVKVAKADVERFPKSERKSLLDARLAEHAQKVSRYYLFNRKLPKQDVFRQLMCDDKRLVNSQLMAKS
jgi:hypothetical protein